MGLFGKWLGAGQGAAAPELLAAIERAVDLVEPRLKEVGGYPERYRGAVARALEHAAVLADQVPGLVHVSREAYASDPLVHALFASPDDIHAALCVSQAMRDYRRDHPEAGEVYALICMQRGSKSLLGMEVDGDRLRHDVPQQAVFFAEHTVVDPGRTEAEARAHMARGFFDSLAAHVRLRVEARRQEKMALEQVRDEWLARLRGAGSDRRAEYQAGLEQTLARLGEVAASLDLRRYGDDFDAVMLVPERHVYLERTALALDGMGLLREPCTGDCRRVEFCDLVGRDRRRWTVAVMYCDRVHEEASLGDRLLLAQRWLGL
ncbi:MAG: hypothetical protein PHS77_06945 [Gallionellaceae bacterium]|nr:hypothetical protein [Gallionellaceae bacterium]